MTNAKELGRTAHMRSSALFFGIRLVVKVRFSSAELVLVSSWELYPDRYTRA